MMQALMQQQTATLSVLRDVAVKGSGQADIQNAAGRTTTASTPDHKPWDQLTLPRNSFCRR